MLFLSACNQNNSNTANNNTNAGKTAGENAKTGVKPVPDSQVVVIETADYGRIVIELFPNIAPQMVERFKKLISEKFYDGTAIHRGYAGHQRRSRRQFETPLARLPVGDYCCGCGDGARNGRAALCVANFRPTRLRCAWRGVGRQSRLG